MIDSAVTPRKLYSFFIDPDIAEGLKALKEREHEAESVIIRRALRLYLEQKGVIAKAERKRAGTRKRP